MKSMKILGLSLLCLLSSLSLFAKKRVSLAEAIRSGWVKAKFEGSGKGYYGQSISMAMKNYTGEEIEVSISPGRMLDSSQPEKQNMVITQQVIVVMGPGEVKRGLLNAMCGEMHDGSPGKGVMYSFGRMAKSSVTGVASLIDQHDYQNRTAQQAVWALTDANPIENIEGDDPVMVEILRSYVKKALGMEKAKKEEFIPSFRRPPQHKEQTEEAPEDEIPAYLRHNGSSEHTSTDDQPNEMRQAADTEARERAYQPVGGSGRFYTLKGKMPVRVPEAGTVQLVLCDPSGKVIKTIRESEAPRPGKLTFGFEVSQRATLRGKYSVKAIQNGAILSKLIYDLD